MAFAFFPYLRLRWRNGNIGEAQKSWLIRDASYIAAGYDELDKRWFDL